MRKLWFYLLVAALSVGGVAVMADALVVTDREQLEAFVDTLSGEIAAERIDAALRYTDPAQQPVELRSGRYRQSFNDPYELATEARDSLSPLLGDDVELLQDSIELEDTHASIALRLGAATGVYDVEFRLAKHGDTWLVSRVRVL